jgi:hypothetical protein
MAVFERMAVGSGVIRADVLVRRRWVLQLERDFAADSLQIAQKAKTDTICDCDHRERRTWANRTLRPVGGSQRVLTPVFFL